MRFSQWCTFRKSGEETEKVQLPGSIFGSFFDRKSGERSSQESERIILEELLEDKLTTFLIMIGFDK